MQGGARFVEWARRAHERKMVLFTKPSRGARYTPQTQLPEDVSREQFASFLNEFQQCTYRCAVYAFTLSRALRAGAVRLAPLGAIKAYTLLPATITPYFDLFMVQEGLAQPSEDARSMYYTEHTCVALRCARGDMSADLTPHQFRVSEFGCSLTPLAADVQFEERLPLKDEDIARLIIDQIRSCADEEKHLRLFFEHIKHIDTVLGLDLFSDGLTWTIFTAIAPAQRPTT